MNKYRVWTGDGYEMNVLVGHSGIYYHNAAAESVTKYENVIAEPFIGIQDINKCDIYVGDQVKVVNLDLLVSDGINKPTPEVRLYLIVEQEGKYVGQLIKYGFNELKDITVMPQPIYHDLFEIKDMLEVVGNTHEPFEEKRSYLKMSRAEMIKEIIGAERVKGQNSMGVSESFYNPFYMVKKFLDETIYPVASLTEAELRLLLQLADYVSEVFY